MLAQSRCRRLQQMQKLTRSVHHVPARFVPGVIGASHLSTGSAALVEQQVREHDSGGA